MQTHMVVKGDQAQILASRGTWPQITVREGDFFITLNINWAQAEQIREQLDFQINKRPELEAMGVLPTSGSKAPYEV